MLKYVVDIPEAHSSSKLSKDLPEELFRIYTGPGSVVLLLACPGSAGVEARCSVCVILLPLHLITQHLNTTRANLWVFAEVIAAYLLSCTELEKMFNCVLLFVSYLIGFSQFGELLLGLWVIWVGIWVVLLCQLVKDDQKVEERKTAVSEKASDSTSFQRYPDKLESN